MPQNVRVLALLAALIVVPASVCRADTAIVPADVVVRVYDMTGLDAGARARAIDVARAITDGAGIRVGWYDCTGDAERGHCDHVRARRNLILRISPTVTSPSLVSRGLIEARAANGAHGLILGAAIVESTTGAGALAMVFIDRVRAIADRTRVPVTHLLGRAIAHEVGHLLLGTNAHTADGLMREVWTDAEIVGDRAADWLFAPSDLTTLRRQARPAEDAAPRRPATTHH